MGRKIVALLQARTDSTRLPRKVLKTLLGKPMIIQELTRVKRSKTINEIVLLTSVESSDDELSSIVSDYGFSVFRGSRDNVLERFHQCAQELKLEDHDIIVRLTGDCPIQDATIIDELINAFLESDFDYMANSVDPIYPDGLDAEVFTFEALGKAYSSAKKLSEKEHVTPFIRESGLFKTANLQKEAVHPEWRLTVDEADDFIVIEKIYNFFKKNDFTFSDVVSLIENNPEIIKANSHIDRNEGYAKSLKDENYSQGDLYVKNEADKWFDRNVEHIHNSQTEYLISLFPKQELSTFDVAEFGVGRATNLNLLSHYVNTIDGYDGSAKSIEMVHSLRKINPNINGKCVNLAADFHALNDYNLIIYGFFTCLITDEEFSTLLKNSKQILKNGGYIYIYDFLTRDNKSSTNRHNTNILTFKRNIEYYLSLFSDFDLIDFRLSDERHEQEYLDNDNTYTIDTNIDSDDYNWEFTALFRLKT